MNEQSPAKKAPSFQFSPQAKEKAKQYQLSKAIFLDVMKNRQGMTKLKNGYIQFNGSAAHPHVVIIAKPFPEKKLWAIVDIQVKTASPAPPPKPVTLPATPPAPPKPKPEPPQSKPKQSQQAEDEFEIIFTHHARDVIKKEDLTEKIVKQLLHDPNSQMYEEDDEKLRFIGRAYGQNLRVIAKFLRDENKLLVITVMRRSENAHLHGAKKRKEEKEKDLTVIFTNHAQEVIRKEFLDERTVEQILRDPKSQMYEEEDEKLRFIGWADGDKFHVIAKYLPNENKLLVITVELRQKAEDIPMADITHFDGEPTATHPGIKFTNHALERMALRNIFPDEVKQTVLSPEKTFDDDDDDSRKFISKPLSMGRSYHVVGKFLDDENKWLIISVWVRGEEDDGSLSTWTPKPRRGRQSLTSFGQTGQLKNIQSQVKLTNNVRDWMQRENVHFSDIEQTILNPHRQENQDDGKIKFIGHPSSNPTLAVVAKYLADEGKWLAITAWQERVKQQPASRQQVHTQLPRPKLNYKKTHVQLTKSIRDAMKRHDINFKDVENVILNPEHQETQHDGTVKFFGNPSKSGTVLAVVAKYLADEGKWLAITAWKDSNKRSKKPAPRPTIQELPLSQRLADASSQSLNKPKPPRQKDNAVRPNTNSKSAQKNRKKQQPSKDNSVGIWAYVLLAVVLLMFAAVMVYTFVL